MLSTDRRHPWLARPQRAVILCQTFATEGMICCSDCWLLGAEADVLTVLLTTLPPAYGGNRQRSPHMGGSHLHLLPQPTLIIATKQITKGQRPPHIQGGTDVVRASGGRLRESRFSLTKTPCSTSSCESQYLAISFRVCAVSACAARHRPSSCHSMKISW